MNLSLKNIINFPTSTMVGLFIICLVVWKSIFWIEGKTIQGEHTVAIISLVFNAGVALLFGKRDDKHTLRKEPAPEQTQDEQGDNMVKIISCIVCVFVFSANFARGQILKVASIDIVVLDGDTFETPRIGATPKKFFRICNIDAPEKAQPYGITAKNALHDLIQAVDTITGRYRGIDTYGRTLIEIDYLDSTMIAQGNAWHYKEYSYKPYLQTIQGYAELYNRGLWNCNPVSRLYPAVWRKLKKKYKRLTLDKEGCL